MKTIIVIPVYKKEMTNNELISFIRCFDVLSKYDICLVAPYNLDISNYCSIFEEKKKKVLLEYFDSSFFISIDSYNRLMLSLEFYKRFVLYDYILIYQLDAYVFDDQLEYWMNKKYDYIGAPFFTDTESIDQQICGNGGFSLRKVESFISVLSSKDRYFFSIRGIWRFYKDRLLIKRIYFSILAFWGIRNNVTFFSTYNRNEDVFFACLRYKRINPFKVVPIKDSMAFSFESNPIYLYSKLKKLPFGCHAWEKYEYEKFWEKYINCK